MTAAALPFDTGELVHQCAEASMPKRLSLRALLWGAAAPTLLLDAMSYALVFALDKVARRMAENSLRIEGLTERICASAPDAQAIDPDDELHTMLVASEREQRQFVQQIRDIRRPTGRRSQQVHDALMRVCVAADAQGDAARNLRAAIQAHDANLDTLRRLRGAGGAACHGAAEIDQSLDSAFENA